MACLIPALRYAAMDMLGVEENEPTPINFREAENAFLLSDAAFIELFRLNRDAARYICDSVRHDLERERTTTRTALSVEDQVLTALLFYASGSSQRVIASNRYIKSRQGTVSRIINDVTKAICINLARHISFPHTQQEKARVKREFFKIARFPGCIGVIDGTFVAIQAPPSNHPHFVEGNYYCHKNLHALNIMVICDANKVIRAIDSTMPGSCHDSYVWRMSLIKQSEEEIFNRTDWIIGDSGYPLEAHLINRYTQPRTEREEAFNTSIDSTRTVVEHAIGILKMQFRCLQQFQVLKYMPDKTGNVVTACAILHNLCVEHNIDLQRNLGEEIIPNLCDRATFCPDHFNQQQMNSHQIGQRIRDNIAAIHF